MISSVTNELPIAFSRVWSTFPIDMAEGPADVPCRRAEGRPALPFTTPRKLPTMGVIDDHPCSIFASRPRPSRHAPALRHFLKFLRASVAYRAGVETETYWGRQASGRESYLLSTGRRTARADCVRSRDFSSRQAEEAFCVLAAFHLRRRSMIFVG